MKLPQKLNGKLRKKSFPFLYESFKKASTLHHKILWCRVEELFYT
jgi:hypothetical protein